MQNWTSKEKEIRLFLQKGAVNHQMQGFLGLVETAWAAPDVSWGWGRNSYSDLWCLNEGVGGAFIFPYVQQQQNVLE